MLDKAISTFVGIFALSFIVFPFTFKINSMTFFFFLGSSETSYHKVVPLIPTTYIGHQ